MAYNTLLVELNDGVLTITLNRPEVHNAFNDELIAEAIDLFSSIDADAVRAVVLQGTGKNFCAGADLNWMSRMVSYTRERERQRLLEAREDVRADRTSVRCRSSGAFMVLRSAAASDSSPFATSSSPSGKRSSDYLR